MDNFSFTCNSLNGLKEMLFSCLDLRVLSIAELGNGWPTGPPALCRNTEQGYKQVAGGHFVESGYLSHTNK